MTSTSKSFSIKHLYGAVPKALPTARFLATPHAGCFLRKPLVFLPILLLITALVHAAPLSISITVDENGHGTLTTSTSSTSTLNGSLQNDPGPGALANVLTYNLLNPPGLVAGDVEMVEPGGGISDFVEFNSSNGTLVFYSDNAYGVDSLADVGNPLNLYVNGAIINEVGPEGNNFAIYTPVAGQPGFFAGADGPVTYTFISDSTVPEPSSLILLGTGLIGALSIARRRIFT